MVFGFDDAVGCAALTGDVAVPRVSLDVHAKRDSWGRGISDEGSGRDWMGEETYRSTSSPLSFSMMSEVEGSRGLGVWVW